jgi:hypothetical protein
MELYIRVDDNIVIEHPIFKENLLLIFKEHDFSVPPLGYMKFEKQDLNLGPYDIFTEQPYFIENNVVKNGVRRVMTDQEKKAKQDEVLASFKADTSYNSWVIDEESCMPVAPVARPDEDPFKWTWRESDQTWIIQPPHPGSEEYIFNKFTASWEIKT